MTRFRDRLRGSARRDRDDELDDDLFGDPSEPANPQAGGVDAARVDDDAAGGALPAAESVAALRRDRERLVQRHDQLRGDLGGLLIEMARRGDFRHALLEQRAAEAVAVETRIAELDGRIFAATDATLDVVARDRRRVTLCPACGARLRDEDANFCAYCGAARTPQ